MDHDEDGGRKIFENKNIVQGAGASHNIWYHFIHFLP